MRIVDIFHKTVKYKGKPVGTVTSAHVDYKGLHVTIKITDEQMERYIKGGAAEFSVKV